MRKFIIFFSLFLILLTTLSLVVFAQRNYSQGRKLGLGLQYTFHFPASGLSSRLWVVDFFGLEGDLYPLTWPPNFAIRLLLKAINTAMLDIYFGGGIGLDSTLAADFQLATGLEFSPAFNFAFSGEIGYALLDGSVTAGFGTHFYF